MILLTSSKLQLFLLKKPSKNKKSQKNLKLCTEIQFLSVFPNITKKILILGEKC